MRLFSLNIIIPIFFIQIALISCGGEQIDRSFDQPKSLKEDMNDVKLTRSLQVGDKIELYGGYDYDPIYLRTPPSSKRRGAVVRFIEGQNKELAAVVKLDQKITGERMTGDIVVLELRHNGQTWLEPTPVHIELCDFMPENKAWKDRKQGEWVEGAASVRLILR